MTTAELLGELDRAIRAATPEELPAFLGKLAEAEAVVRMHLAAPVTTVAVVGEPLLDAEGIAEYLGFPMEDGKQTGVEWVKCKLRDHTLPAVKLPGTKGRDGREWRSRPSWLDTWVASLGLDGAVSSVLTSSHEGCPGAEAETTARTLATGIRRARRRPRGHGFPMGEQRRSGTGTDRAAHPHVGAVKREP